MSYTVAQNTSFLTVASVAQRFISFVYFIVVARFVGVYNLGDYFFALAFTTVFAVLADVGLSPVLTRESSKNPEQAEKYFNTVLSAKIVFGLLAYVAVVVAVNLLNYSSSIQTLIYISGVTMLFDNLQNAFYSVFRARKNLVYEAGGIIGAQVLTLVIGTVALLLHAPLYWLILAYTIPSLISCAYAAYFLQKRYSVHYTFGWDAAVFKQFAWVALPFAVSAGLGRLYAYSDSFIMSKMLTSGELGLWSVPFKIVAAFQFIPTALSASVYPVMSSLYLTDKPKVGELFEKSYRYLLLISLPMVAGIFALAPSLITTFFGVKYVSSIPLLHIIIFTLPLGFLGLINGAVLNATNHQKQQMYILGASLGINIALNLLLIPRYGTVGAAISSLISTSILWLLGHAFSSLYAPIRQLRMAKIALQIALPAFLMAVVVKAASGFVPLLLNVLLGTGLYGLLLFGSGALTMDFVNESLGKIKIKI